MKNMILGLMVASFMVGCGGSGSGSAGAGATKDDYKMLTKSYDDSGDGVAEAIIYYTYDFNGNKSKESLVSYDSSRNSYIKKYTYDANDNNVKMEYDRYADDTIDSITRYTYDANDNNVKKEYDGYANDTIDSVTRYTYDANDNMLTKSKDYDGDGVMDTITTYTYDSKGNELSYNKVRTDDASSETPRSAYPSGVTEYTYDSNNNILTKISKSISSEGDELIIRWHYSYDSNANLLSLEINFVSEGGLLKYTYTYDTNNNILSSKVDNNADGVIDGIITYTWGVPNDNTIDDNEDTPNNGIPNIYGNSYIQIYGNINPNSSLGKLYLSQSSSADGWINVAVDGSVHCTDYQYSSHDRISSITINGVIMIQYIKGNQVCTEYNLESAHPAHGGSSIVQSHE